MKHKHLLFTLFLSAVSLLSVAQVGYKFKEGYIINNLHERIDCLIRDVGCEESAVNFEYKLLGSRDIEEIELSKVQAFGIENEVKCVRALISVDFSPTRIAHVKDTTSQWEEGHAFLKVLVEGDAASLYSHYAHGRYFFFYSLGDSDILPLVYKKQYVGVSLSQVNQIIYNNTYKEQLDEHLGCDNLNKAENVAYTKKDLVNYFVSYHMCKNLDYKVFESAQTKRGVLLLKPSLSLNRTQLGVHSLIDASPMVYFTKENCVSFGVELEYVFPFSDYQWSIFGEANYLSYKTDEITAQDRVNPDFTNEYDISYKSVEFPVGFAYYVHLNQDHRLYLKGAFVPHFIFSDSYIGFNPDDKKDFSSSSRFLFGVGYNYRRLALEFRYYTPQNITQNIYKRGSDLTQLSLKMSYSFQLFGDKEVR